MFEEYLQDAHDFYEIGRKASLIGNEKESRRYYRVTIMCASCAMEAFVNYIASSFAEAKNIDKIEISFLNDQELQFVVGKGVTTRIRYNAVDEKIKALIFRFIPDFDFNASISWNNFKIFKDFRDSLIHSRKVEDETPINDYEKRIKEGLTSIIELMNEISKGMFRKPLRKKILDLTPDK